MNEGVGSTTIIVIIIVFISFVSAYMAYNVNYTKAFRMKNKIIAVYEEYNGECDSNCHQEIKEYSKQIGYSSSSIDCGASGFNPSRGSSSSSGQLFTDPGYCEYYVVEDKNGCGDEDTKVVYTDNNCVPGHYYRIVTRIDIRIPIIQNVLNLRFLDVTGDTKTFKADK